VQRLDPSYFEFLADAYAAQQGEPNPPGGDDAAAVPMHAALALRTAYVHAAETLLALLLGSVQAPDCLLGWMHLYQPGDLRSMIKKIDAYERFPSKLNATRVTWEQIAASVFSPLVLDDKEQEARIERNFADLWRHIAREWARQDTTSKYNSIKHGLRTHAGGFRLAMGVEDRPRERAAPARMRSFGGSRYGSSYCELRPIGSRETSAGVQRRLRLALQVADAIARVDRDEVARTWFQGLNPQLSDRSPARLLREGDLDEVGPEVVGAARAFLAGG